MATVEVIIDPKNNTTQYEVNGIQGEDCDALTRLLREHNEELEYEQTSEYCETQEKPDYVEDME